MKSKQELQDRANALKDQQLLLKESIDELRIINAKLWTADHFINEVIQTAQESGDLYDGDKKDAKIGKDFETYLRKTFDTVLITKQEAETLLSLREEQLQEIEYKLDALNF